ncbi:MAG: GntR family transcriptional regulator [Spirochaetota bacterium]
MVLVETSSRPLYEQLKLIVLHDIEVGVYKHGQRLPSEMELSARYQVSRITVRRTISELAKDGYLISQQGKGTFVNYIKGEYKYLSFDSISDNTTNPDLKRTNRILSKDIVPANGTVSGYLRIEPEAKLIRLKRLMFENDKPYMIDTAFFRLDLYPGIYDLLADNISTFALIQSRYGISFAKAEKALSVVRAGLEEAEYLGCVPGDPLFSTSKIIYGEDGTPVHYSHYLVHGDRCIYTLTVDAGADDIQIHYKD